MPLHSNSPHFESSNRLTTFIYPSIETRKKTANLSQLRNDCTQRIEALVRSIVTAHAPNTTCLPPCFRYRPKFARVSSNENYCSPATHNSDPPPPPKNESLSRVSVLSNPQIFHDRDPVNRIESTIFRSLRASRCTVFTTRTITRKFRAPRAYTHGFPSVIATRTRSAAEIFAARIGQRLCLNLGCCRICGFSGGGGGRFEILNWNGDFEGEGCRLGI